MPDALRGGEPGALQVRSPSSASPDVTRATGAAPSGELCPSPTAAPPGCVRSAVPRTAEVCSTTPPRAAWKLLCSPGTEMR